MAAQTGTISKPFDSPFEGMHTRQRGLWAQAFQRLRRNKLAMVAGILLLFVFALTLSAEFVPLVQRHNPAAQNYQAIDVNPGSSHFLGTDGLGRDMWARLLQATLFSLKIGFGAEIIVLALGISLGMAAALGGRVTDGIVVWITDLAYAFPDLLMIILFRQVLLGRDWPIVGSGDPQIPGLGGEVLVTILALSFVTWVTICRLVRGQILSIKEQDYVTAARSIGANNWRIVRVHMLPNTLSTVIVAVTFGIPQLIFAEAALAFIGLGVPPPSASLGSLIQDGYDKLYVNNLLVMWPAIVMIVLMLCFTFLGDGLRDALDPRTRK